MATIYDIERKRKEILLDLKPNEIEAFYNELNKKAIEGLGTVKNNFTFNPDEIIKANEELKETNDILIKKYPYIESLESSSRLNLLLDKYAEVLNEAQALIFYFHLKQLSNLYTSLKVHIDYLETVLTKFYFRYHFRSNLLETFLLEELKVPEDIVLDTLEPYIYNNNFFYGGSLEKEYNSYIETIVVNIDYYITKIDNYSKFNITPSAYEEKDVVNLLEDIVKLQSLNNDLIKRYENLKLNPFEVAINVVAEVRTDIVNKLLDENDVDLEKRKVEELKEKLLDKAPSYNFESFEFIVPEGVD